MSYFEECLHVFDIESEVVQKVFAARRYDAIQNVRILVDVAFDDPGASFTLGTDVNHSLIATADDSDLGTVGEYQLPEMFVINTGVADPSNGFADQSVYLYFSPFASTVGSVRLYFEIERR